MRKTYNDIKKEISEEFKPTMEKINLISKSTGFRFSFSLKRKWYDEFALYIKMTKSPRAFNKFRAQTLTRPSYDEPGKFGPVTKEGYKFIEEAIEKIAQESIEKINKDSQRICDLYVDFWS